PEIVAIEVLIDSGGGKAYNIFYFFFQAEDGIRDKLVTGVQTCALPISATIRQSVAESGKVRFSPAKPIKAVKKGGPPCIIELFRAERLLLCRRGGGKNAGPKASAIMESLVQACLPRGNTFVVPLAHLK